MPEAGDGLRKHKLTDSIPFCDHNMTGWQHRYGLLGCSRQIRMLGQACRVWNQGRLGGHGTTDMTALLGRDRIIRGSVKLYDSHRSFTRAETTGELGQA